MPDAEEQQSQCMANDTVAEECQPLVDVLGWPGVSVDIEACHVMPKFSSAFKYQQVDVSTTIPKSFIVLWLAIVCDAKRDASTYNKKIKNVSIFIGWYYI